MKRVKLRVCISTLNEGLRQVPDILRPEREDVGYLILHQVADEYEAGQQTLEKLNRGDVELVQLQGKGVTRSRNEAIRRADSDLALFSDDDVTYRESDFDVVIETFNENPDLDVAIFKIRTPEGDPEYKVYPAERVRYRKAPSVGTIQVAFRPDSILKKKVWFDERFGAGQELLIGSDERIFIQDCIDADMNVEYFPKYIVEHPFESAAKGIEKYDKRKIWVTGGYDCRTNGAIAIPKAFLGTLKFMPDMLKNGVNPLFYFYHRLSAVMYIMRTNKSA